MCRSNTSRMQNFFFITPLDCRVLLRSILMLLYLDIYSNIAKHVLVYFCIFSMSYQSKNYLEDLAWCNLALAIHRLQMVLQPYNQGRYPLHILLSLHCLLMLSSLLSNATTSQEDLWVRKGCVCEFFIMHFHNDIVKVSFNGRSKWLSSNGVRAQFV